MKLKNFFLTTMAFMLTACTFVSCSGMYDAGGAMDMGAPMNGELADNEEYTEIIENKFVKTSEQLTQIQLRILI